MKTKTKKCTFKLNIPFTVEAPAEQLDDAVNAAFDAIDAGIKLPKRVKVEGAKVVVTE